MRKLPFAHLPIVAPAGVLRFAVRGRPGDGPGSSSAVPATGAGRRDHDSAPAWKKPKRFPRPTSSRSCTAFRASTGRPSIARDADAEGRWPRAPSFAATVWCLEFTFKPVRMIWVDVPQASGKMQRTLVWYMVYHVRNTGRSAAADEERRRRRERSSRSIARCGSSRSSCSKSHEFKKAYLDRIIPTAIQAIQEKEDPNRKLHNSVEIGSQLVPVSSDLVDKSLWGVATWEGRRSADRLFLGLCRGADQRLSLGRPARGLQAGASADHGPGADAEEPDAEFLASWRRNGRGQRSSASAFQARLTIAGFIAKLSDSPSGSFGPGSSI